MGSVVHVIPVNDIIDHDGDTADCVCGPTPEFVANGGIVISHYALDGREQGPRLVVPVVWAAAKGSKPRAAKAAYVSAAPAWSMKLGRLLRAAALRRTARKAAGR